MLLKPVSFLKKAAAASGITMVAERQERFAANASQTLTSVDLPSGLQENDVVILAAGCDDNTSVTGFISIALGVDAAGQGWTVLFHPQSGISGFLLLKRMGATPDTTIDLYPATAKAAPIVMQAFRGVDTTTALDVTTTTSGPLGGPAVPDPPSITPTNNNCMIVAVGYMDDVATVFTAAPSGYGDLITEYGDQAAIGMASKILPTAAAEDPGSFSHASTDAVWAATLALRPA